jgi:hypothetical protein
MRDRTQADKDQRMKCAFKGCNQTHRRVISGFLLDDGWAFLAGWGPGVEDGCYCPAHAAALDAMLEDGSLEEIQRGGHD